MIKLWLRTVRGGRQPRSPYLLLIRIPEVLTQKGRKRLPRFVVKNV
jgi:hypothetical protein